MSATSSPQLAYAPDELLKPNDIATVLAFLAYARPLVGTSYDDDERFEHGRELLLLWLETSSAGQSTSKPATVSHRYLIYECAEVLYFLRNLEPLLSNTAIGDERRDTVDMGRFRVPSGWNCGFCGRPVTQPSGRMRPQERSLKRSMRPERRSRSGSKPAHS